MKELLTVRQVAEILQLHEATIRRYISDGKLASVRIGRRIRVPRAALDAFIASQAEPAAVEGDAFREPAVAYRTASSSPPVVSLPPLMAQVVDELAELNESDLNQVFEFIADLKARRQEQARKASKDRILEEAHLLALEMADWPRDKVWNFFEEAMEEARRQTIQAGTSFAGDWIGD